MSQYLRLLQKNPDYTRLWLAQVVSLLGDWFNTIVLSALVANYSGGSGTAVSGFLLARFIPSLIIGPFAGTLIDRFNRKNLLIASDVSRALVVLLLLFATGPDTLWLIYLLTFIQFSLSTVFEPGRNAIMPSLLHKEDLVLANTLGSVTWSVMLAGGAIIGGLVAASFGAAFALIVDSITFLVSAVLIAGITVRPDYVRAVHQDTAAPTSTERGFRDGLRYLRQRPGLAATLLVKLGQSLGNVDALMIIYATELFVVGEDGIISLSLMYAAFGLGAVIGPLALNHFNDGSVRVMRRLIIIGYAWITLAWLVFGGASSLALVSLALVVRAMGGSVNWTYSSVIIQKSVADEYLGRMFSLDMIGFQLASAASILITGQLVDSLGVENVRVIVLGMGALSLVPLVLWGWVVRYMEKRRPAVAAAGD
ncbi:MAG: MFS transporter [Anaerolineaceae bacterium]|nr:MFS transporter [Anaerolineaceae bacterium]